MSLRLSKLQCFMRKDSFSRDLLILMLVSIIIGSVLANAVSFAASTYFSKTLSNLVGDYGEYDIVIQAREEMKDDTQVQIQKIIDDVFPGAKLKEGPTITGKTSFFIALPEEYKTKQVYENLSKTFGSIPGGAGVGVMTEPRMTIRGVPDGAKNMLMDNISAIDGVRFAFRDGASIGVILTSVGKAQTVTESIKALLKKSQVIEIAFPVGSEPANPIKMGDAIALDMQNSLHLEYAQNVSVDGKNDDMTYMVSTMMELKRFLQAYASQVVLTPVPGVNLTRGDVVVFQGNAPNAPAVGNAVDKSNILMQVTGIRADGTVEGAITQGDASGLTNNAGYKLDKNVIESYAGTVTYRNPRQELGTALNETSKIVAQIPGITQDTKSMSTIALNALDNYGNSINAMQSTLGSLSAAGDTITRATSGLANFNTASLKYQLDSSSQAMGGLVNTLQWVKLLNGDVTSTISNLTSAQQNINNLRSGLNALDNISTDAQRAKNSIDSIVINGQNTIAQLQAFDVQGARSNLASVNSHLAQVEQINVPLVTAQLTYMSASAPNLQDEEISHSVALLDKFIAGQVIPGARIQILTTSNISTDAIAPVVYRQVGHNNVSLYSTDLGVIEPNPRTELYSILNEVKAILAGMTAMILTILLLVLDHTAIMTVFRHKRKQEVVVTKNGWRKRLSGITGIFTAPERQYGMVVGAVLLTAMFVLSRAGIPYLPWIGVPLLGALLGLIVAKYAEKISPIAHEEVMAGEALGLSFDEIMREIVIPSARPGLLQKLNSRKVKFK